MSPILTVFKREFLGYFRSPVAYVFLVVFLMASIGLPWFLGGFFESNDANLNLFFLFIPWVYLFLTPAVGMRLWAEEKRSGTWELLLTFPISPLQAVLGKFLAGWLFICLALGLTVTMPLTVAYVGDPDWGPILTGYFGAALMAGTYLSICSLTSALTKNQVISFVLSTLACLVFVFLGWSIFNDFMAALNFPTWLVDAVANFSFIAHFNPMMKGLIGFHNLVFFVSLSAFCLWLNVLALER